MQGFQQCLGVLELDALLNRLGLDRGGYP